ncbi:peptide-methionine (S)-S-oxide reductase MsrA [Kushneria marisflavi]|uniref:Peptide methionine sulfoxide reductase MsrA n=1 Tax=Kushneria marisflavi TaxID=157779 RepID=A0A240UJM6_9GAMM|nr:peptide-methionine (S)-S-oxide reductase MsrA [Kushneria marisflavi]ART61678.1 peptide-methionine (S)-S-oxide reductase [Kushneria marisflavi]RKD86693.1 peptide-methionine (S)-S-oxide reductase [Kushneria marisflavi]
MFGYDRTRMPSAEEALTGRDTPMSISGVHHVNDRDISSLPPEGFEDIVLGLGCFWGAERLFWQLPGVWVTAVGYAGGYTPNPTYDEVCTGKTGHAEVVRVVFNPSEISLAELLKVFWEAHDPTQGMRQGNDIGNEYRSMILVRNEKQREIARKSLEEYEQALKKGGKGAITTGIDDLNAFYYAEEYHQQYLSKNPMGYCGLKGTGVSCPI